MGSLLHDESKPNRTWPLALLIEPENAPVTSTPGHEYNRPQPQRLLSSYSTVVSPLPGGPTYLSALFTIHPALDIYNTSLTRFVATTARAGVRGTGALVVLSSK